MSGLVTAGAGMGLVIVGRQIAGRQSAEELGRRREERWYRFDQSAKGKNEELLAEYINPRADSFATKWREWRSR